VIGLPRGVSVYAFDEPCDMRKSFDTLTALVVEHMRHDVLAGDVYLFVSRGNAHGAEPQSAEKIGPAPEVSCRRYAGVLTHAIAVGYIGGRATRH